VEFLFCTGKDRQTDRHREDHSHTANRELHKEKIQKSTGGSRHTENTEIHGEGEADTQKYINTQEGRHAKNI
jgi:hypothetical protein